MSFHDTFSLTVAEDINDKIMEWNRGEMPADLTSIPRVGKTTAECFKAEGVETTFALLGKFLTLKSEGCGPTEHCEKFWIWINHATRNNKIASKDKAVICRAICLRADLLLPGLYDEKLYIGGGGGK